MYSLPTEGYSGDRLAANTERQQQTHKLPPEWKWPLWEETKPVFHTGSLIWRVLSSGMGVCVLVCVSVCEGLHLCLCTIRWPNVASMKPTSGPRVPDISVIDSEFIEKLYDTDGAYRKWQINHCWNEWSTVTKPKTRLFLVKDHFKPA